MREAPRILFIPVSGAFGMGEYARCLSIAFGVRRQWPTAHIQFMLSRQASYAATTPFTATLLSSSPTFHTAAVKACIQQFKPDIVIFDNAGRTAQVREAARGGARIVFISSRSRQRRKAFRWRWMRLLDEHWVAYPRFLAGSLTFFERFKLAVLGRPVIRYLDVFLSRTSKQDSGQVLDGLRSGHFVLLVPGGGTGHPGASHAAATFFAAAAALAVNGTPTVVVGPTGSASTVAAEPGTLPANLRCFNSLPQEDLAELMSGARLVITNGGSTLLQAIGCGRACVGVPIAQDQPQRIQRCVDAGVAMQAKLDADSIAQVAGQLLRDEAGRAALAARAADLGLLDGVQAALHALTRLLETA